jgi:hypothetical protein
VRRILTTVNQPDDTRSAITALGHSSISSLSQPQSSPFSRTKIENLSKVNPRTAALIEQSLSNGQNLLGQTENLIGKGIAPIFGGMHKFLNSNHSSKQILAALTGASLLLTGVTKGIVNCFNLLTGKSNGEFKIGEIILSSMLGWLGYDALQYAQGKSNTLSSSQSILTRVIPIFLMKGFNSMLSNPNSATAKITNAIGLKDPTQSLVSDLGGMINPAKLFGWGLKPYPTASAASVTPNFRSDLS